MKYISHIIGSIALAATALGQVPITKPAIKNAPAENPANASARIVMVSGDPSGNAAFPLKHLDEAGFKEWLEAEVGPLGSGLTKLEKPEVANWAHTVGIHQLASTRAPSTLNLTVRANNGVTALNTNEVVHISALYRPNGFGPLKLTWMMATTPYPLSNDKYENPSFLVSSDGEAWAAPAGLTNPIVATPAANDFNADPVLFYLNDSTLAIAYTSTTALRTGYNISMVTSTDGVTWTAPQIIMSDTAAPYRFASPAIWQAEDGSWKMIATDITGGEGTNALRMWTTPSLTTPTWTATVNTPCVLLNYPTHLKPWHAEVREVNGRLIMCLASQVGAQTSTAQCNHLGWSEDGVTWTFQKEPISSSNAQSTGTIPYDGILDYKNSVVWNVDPPVYIRSHANKFAPPITWTASKSTLFLPRRNTPNGLYLDVSPYGGVTETAGSITAWSAAAFRGVTAAAAFAGPAPTWTIADGVTIPNASRVGWVGTAKGPSWISGRIRLNTLPTDNVSIARFGNILLHWSNVQQSLRIGVYSLTPTPGLYFYAPSPSLKPQAGEWLNFAVGFEGGTTPHMVCNGWYSRASATWDSVTVGGFLGENPSTANYNFTVEQFQAGSGYVTEKQLREMSANE